MSSKVADISAAVCAMIQTGIDAEAFSMEFTLRRLYLPKVELKDLGTLTVTVVAKNDVRTPFTRAKRQRDIRIDVAVQKRLTNDPASSAAAALAELDGLMGFVEELTDLFDEGTAVTGVADAYLINIANDPIYDPAHLNEHKAFSSLITLTIKTA